DLSHVDLELHALPGESRGRIPTISSNPSASASSSVRVSPGGSSGTLEPNGDGTYIHRDTQFNARVDYDGTVEFEGRGRGPTLGPDDEGKAIVGRIPLDVTDMILGASGQDPY